MSCFTDTEDNKPAAGKSGVKQVNFKLPNEDAKTKQDDDDSNDSDDDTSSDYSDEEEEVPLFVWLGPMTHETYNKTIMLLLRRQLLKKLAVCRDQNAQEFCFIV